MTTYLALLRGVNVGGANKVPMKELRGLFEDLDHEDVRTYLQSGNVVFEGRSSSSKKLAGEAERAISEAFGVDISVILRTRPELKRVAAGNPFPTEDVKPSLLHVMFLSDAPSPASVKTLDPDRSPPDEFKVKGREVYLWYPDGSARTKLTIDYFEQMLGTRATSRNWNTIVKVLELMGPVT